MKSQIKDTLVMQTHVKQFSVATVLSTNFEDKDFAECVEDDLEEEFPELNFISGDKFRDALYPWFEPNTLPRETGELEAILNKTLVRERIEALGLELLIYVHGNTCQSDFEGFVGASPMPPSAAAGYAVAERETHIGTTVWDLREKVRVGDTDVDFQGKVHMPILGIPIIIPAFTESSACSETAKRIANCLKSVCSYKGTNLITDFY